MKKIKEEGTEEVETTEVVPKVAPLTETFSNGEMNVLKDKLNEVISKI